MYKKYIFMIITIIGIFSTSLVYGEGNQVVIDSIFTKDQGDWYPGRVETKDFYIRNNKENNIKIDRLYIQLKSSQNTKTNEIFDENSKQFKEISENSVLELTHGGDILFRDKLNNILSEKGIVLSKEINIKSNEKELLNMTIDMNEDINDDAQYLESVFNIGVAYKVDESIGTGGLTNEEDNNVNGLDKLPQTGTIINAASLLGLGIIIIGTGLVLNKKSSDRQGGKHHE